MDSFPLLADEERLKAAVLHYYLEVETG
uniref:Uncharacterized protein n=1 Tax=Arundo donax TaxID=35708 RepID=A0A0A9HPJ9_ARUDO